MTFWVVIVQAPLADARRAYLAWLRDHGLFDMDIDPELLRVDYMHDESGEIVRYRIAAELARALNVEGPVLDLEQ